MTGWLLVLGGCTDPVAPDVERIDVPGVAVPRRSLPLTGGIADLDDGWLVASDPDGDRVLLLELASETLREVRFPTGWAPGAVATDGGRALIALGTGAAAVLQISPLSVRGIPTVCGEPRGVDAVGDRGFVACATGELVELDLRTATVTASDPIAADLHDVVLDADGTAVLTVFRSAEVLRVDGGEIVDRFLLPTIAPPDPEAPTLIARVARRMVRTGDGRLAVLHQAAVVDPVVILPDAPSYGSGACDAVARPLLTWIDAEGPTATVRLDAIGPVEVGFWPEGDGAFPEPQPVLGVSWPDGTAGLQSVYPPSGLSDPTLYCLPRGRLFGTPGPIAGIVVGPDGPIAVSRQPFAIEGPDGPLVPADPEAVVDEGFALFQAPSPSGLACATCHAEGRDDGHTWVFETFGPRRTQGLTGGLLRTAPYHWDGALADLGEVLADTGVLRMGHLPPSAAAAEALGRWLDALAPPVPPPVDPAGVADGEAVFSAAGCPECHRPPAYTDNRTVDVGTGGPVQVPSLIGVSARLPLMHDGCAATLRDRFTDPVCGGDLHGSSIDEADLDALIGFLTSL